MRRRIRELEVAAFAEVAVDRFLGDQPLDRLVAVEGLAVERVARLLAVALDQLARAVLVAGMDDPAVARRRAPAERPGLEERDRDPAPCQLAGRVDPGVAAADDDDVRGVRQRPTRSIGECRHRRAPQRAPFEIGVHVGRGHRRSVGHRRLQASAAPDRATGLAADLSHPRRLPAKRTISCSRRRGRGSLVVAHVLRSSHGRCRLAGPAQQHPGPARAGRSRRIDHDHGRRAARRHTRASRDGGHASWPATSSSAIC